MQQLKGVGVALVTPFQQDMAVDYAALERLIEYTLRGKVDYLVTLGTTGEAATLSEKEQLEVLQFTLKTAAGRVPVVVGLGGNNTQEILRKLAAWPLDEVTAILSVSPYYSKPSQEGIYQHYAAIATASPKPVILYNVPGRTASNISADTCMRLARQFPHKIIGIKEASGNMVQALHLLNNRPEEFLLISGDDHITMPLIACGFDGVISVIANSHPAQFSQMVHMCLNGQFAEARPLLNNLLEKMDLCFVENNPAGVKALLSEMGIISNYLRLPLVPLSATHMSKLKSLI